MKKIFLVLFILGLISASVTLGLIFFLDVNQYKDQITQLIEDKTQRQVKLEGDISLGLFPPLALDIAKVSLLDASGKDNLAYIENLSLNVEMLPLLSQEIVVKSLRIDGLKLRLIVAANGQKNWEIPAESELSQAPVGEIVKLANQVAANDEAETDSDSADMMARLNSLSLDDVQVKNTEILYQDVAANKIYNLKEINATADLKQSSSNIDLTAVIAGLPSKHAGLSFKGKVNILSAQSLQLENAALSLGEIDATIDATADVSDVVKNIDAVIGLNTVNVTPYLAWLSSNGAQKVEYAEPTFSIVELVFAPALAQSTSTTTAKQAFSWSNEPIDLSALRAIAGRLNITFDGLQYENYVLGKGDIASRFQQGKVDTTITELNLFDGVLRGDIQVAALKTSGVNLATDLQLEGLKLEALPVDIKQSLFEPVGDVSVKMALDGSGQSQKTLISTLKGVVTLAAKGAEFQGLADMLQSKITNPLLNAAIAPYRESFGKISSLTGTWNVAKGVLRNDDFSAQSSPVSFIGKGEVNLPTQQVYYRFEPLKSGGGEKLNLSGVELPDILIKGTFSKPEVKFDTGDTVRGLIQKSLEKDGLKSLERGIRENRDGLLDGLKDNLNTNDGLKNLLQGL